jgi:type I restriction enzyme M protein
MARWENIKNNAKNPKIGQIIDDAMILIKKENPSLKEILDKIYAGPELDKEDLENNRCYFKYKGEILP